MRDRRVVAVVAARDEADRVGATVAALRGLPEVTEVVVVDDGSVDGTAGAASAAGARVLVAPRALGKGTALEGALWRIPPADLYLLADGDLGASAGGMEAVLRPVAEGRADMAVAVLPPPPTGGFGLVKRAARAAVGAVCGFRPTEPLSGQRVLTRDVLDPCRPLAPGFGVETALFADAVRLGFRVVEVPVDLEHRFTGRDVPGFLHRGRQGVHVLRAALPRLIGLR